MSFSQAVQALGSMEKGLFLYEKGGLPLKKALCAPAAQIGILLVPKEGSLRKKPIWPKRLALPVPAWAIGSFGGETAPLAALSAILYETDNF